MAGSVMPHTCISHHPEQSFPPVAIIKQQLYADCLRTKLRPVPELKQKDSNVLTVLEQSWPIANAKTELVLPKPHVHNP